MMARSLSPVREEERQKRSRTNESPSPQHDQCEKSEPSTSGLQQQPPPKRVKRTKTGVAPEHQSADDEQTGARPHTITPDHFRPAVQNMVELLMSRIPTTRPEFDQWLQTRENLEINIANNAAVLSHLFMILMYPPAQRPAEAPMQTEGPEDQHPRNQTEPEVTYGDIMENARQAAMQRAREHETFKNNRKRWMYMMSRAILAMQKSERFRARVEDRNELYLMPNFGSDVPGYPYHIQTEERIQYLANQVKQCHKKFKVQQLLTPVTKEEREAAKDSRATRNRPSTSGDLLSVELTPEQQQQWKKAEVEIESQPEERPTEEDPQWIKEIYEIEQYWKENEKNV